MRYLENNTVKEFVQKEVINRLLHNKGLNTLIILGELKEYLFPYLIFDTNWEAEEFINEHWLSLKEVLEKIRNEFDTELICKLMLDIFDNQNQSMSFIIKEIAGNILFKCETVKNNWGKETILTDEVIDKLIEEIKGV